MLLDQAPVDHVVAEQRVDVLVCGFRIRAVEAQIVPVAYPREQLEPQQGRQAENRQRLALGVGVDLAGLDVGVVAQQGVQDVHRLPHPAGYEAGEQRDVVVGHQPERDRAEPAVADVGLGQQVVLPRVELGAVGCRGVPVAPHPRHVQFREGVDEVG